MTRRIGLVMVGVAVLVAGGLRWGRAQDPAGAAISASSTSAELADATASNIKAVDPAQAAGAVELFRGIEEGKLEMRFIARSDRAARVILTNKTKQEITVLLPAAFAGVPVAPQRNDDKQSVGAVERSGFQIRFVSDDGRGNRMQLPTVRGPAALGEGVLLAQRAAGGVGGVRNNNNNNNFGGNQGIGGGFGGGQFGGGGFGGGQFGGGGGGFFSIPPEQTKRIDVPVLCLDHGLTDPSSSKPYKMVPVEQYVDRPAVVELLKAFGRGELQHGAAQAAAWHLNNDLSWAELAAKQQGTVRSVSRPPYFSAFEIQAGLAYSGEASRRGQFAQMQRQLQGLPQASADDSRSDSTARSTAPDDSNQPAKAKASEKSETKPDVNSLPTRL